LVSVVYILRPNFCGTGSTENINYTTIFPAII
jgi:hypothetical protein